MRTETRGEPLPFVRAAALASAAPEEHWLVRPLWPKAAVGILGGSPKSCKSWLGLDLAVSVASGTPCLGHFAVEHAATTLVYLAEDSLPMVRARIASLCEARGVSLAGLDLNVLTVPCLRLDQQPHQLALAETLARLRSGLLVLDPLVRLHRLDENDAREVSGLLGYLRELQRTFNVAIVVVHHARKRTATSPGEALRGSSDIYAWTDVTAHLSRTPEDDLVLRVEHRSAPSPEPVRLKLVSRPDGTRTHLELRQAAAQPAAAAVPVPATLASALLAALTGSQAPVAVETLRERVKAQKQRVTRCLEDLEKQGFVKRSGPRGGWQLATRAVAEAPTTAEQLC
jgi:hypothetical protein